MKSIAIAFCLVFISQVFISQVSCAENAREMVERVMEYPQEIEIPEDVLNKMNGLTVRYNQLEEQLKFIRLDQQRTKEGIVNELRIFLAGVRYGKENKGIPRKDMKNWKVVGNKAKRIISK